MHYNLATPLFVDLVEVCGIHIKPRMCTYDMQGRLNPTTLGFAREFPSHIHIVVICLSSLNAYYLTSYT